MPTNKEVLNRGFKYAVIALPMFFIGPTIIHSSFKNEQHPFFIPILGIGILLCILAVVFLFKALKTIMESQTDDPNP